MPATFGSELVLKPYAKSFRGPTLIRASLTTNEIFCKVYIKKSAIGEREMAITYAAGNSSCNKKKLNN